MVRFMDDRTRGQRTWNGVRLALMWVSAVAGIGGLITLAWWLGDGNVGVTNEFTYDAAFYVWCGGLVGASVLSVVAYIIRRATNCCPYRRQRQRLQAKMTCGKNLQRR